MQTVSFILLAVLFVSGQDKSSVYPPKAAPQVYVSHKFGLTMTVPPKLSFCPLPKGWSGTEEGTVVFLETPSGCLPPSDSSTTRPTTGFVPSITVRYHRNDSRYDSFDGTIPAPQTSEDFGHQFCPSAFESQDFKLFDKPAIVCRSEIHGERTKIMLMAVYDAGRHNLTVSLLTTHERLAQDSQVLAAMSSSIATCQAVSKNKHEAKTCPHQAIW